MKRTIAFLFGTPMEVMDVVRWILFVASTLGMMSLLGCGGRSDPLQNVVQGGTLVTTVYFPRLRSATGRLIPSTTSEIIITLNGEGLPTPMKGKATPSNPRVVFSNVPPGAKFVLVFSRTSPTDPLPATIGAATATVTPGTTTTVTVEMNLTGSPNRLHVFAETPNKFAFLGFQGAFFLGNNNGLQWFGFGETVFPSPVALPNGATIGQSASQPTPQGTATMRLVGVMGIGVPAGDFANCVVVEFNFGSFRGVLYLARQFGPVMLVDGAPLGFSGQPTKLSSLPFVLVSGQVPVSGQTILFNFANPFNGLQSPYNGQLSDYFGDYFTARQTTFYDFSGGFSPENPPL